MTMIGVPRTVTIRRDRSGSLIPHPTVSGALIHRSASK